MTGSLIVYDLRPSNLFTDTKCIKDYIKNIYCILNVIVYFIFVHLGFAIIGCHKTTLDYKRSNKPYSILKLALFTMKLNYCG